MTPGVKVENGQSGENGLNALLNVVVESEQGRYLLRYPKFITKKFGSDISLTSIIGFVLAQIQLLRD